MAWFEMLFNDALVSEWKQIPASMLEQLEESFSRKVEALKEDILHINAHDFELQTQMCFNKH